MFKGDKKGDKTKERIDLNLWADEEKDIKGVRIKFVFQSVKKNDRKNFFYF